MPREPLRDGSMIRASGPLDRRFRAALRRLTDGPEYTSAFLLSDLTGSFWRVFTEYCGDISGRYLGAVALGQTYTGETSPMLSEVARAAVMAQLPDGHFNTEQAIDAVNYPLIYGHGRLLKGLVEYYSVTPDPGILAAIRRLAGYFLETAGVWRAEAARGNEEFMYYTQGLEGIVGAYRITGDPGLLDLARGIAEMVWAEPKHHSHSYLSSLLGVLALYEATGEARYLDFVREKRDLVGGMVTVDGGVSEMLPWKIVTEFCSVADWLMLHARLGRVTGEARDWDRAERILLNAVHFNQFSTGGFGTWHVDRDHGYPGRVEVGSGEAYWCCCFHGARALYEALTHACTWDERGVSVHFHLDGEASFPELGLTLRQETDYPASGRVRLQVVESDGRTLALRLRIPGWASGARVEINGRAEPVEVVDGAVTWERAWKPGDTLDLSFRLGLRLEDRDGPVAGDRLHEGAELEGVTLWWGGLLLSIDEMFNATRASDEKTPWTAPDRLLLPPMEEGTFALPHGEALPVPPEWPVPAFFAPATGSGEASDGVRRVVLTPLARPMEYQPPSAPSTKTRYGVRIVSPDEWSRLLED